MKSGIEDILIVTGKAKRPIEDHFDSNIELEQNLLEKGKTELLKLVEETTDINLHFIRQSHPKGLGHAVLQAKAFVGNEPFVVMLGDDLMNITGNETPLTKDLINDYEKTHASTIAVMKFLMMMLINMVSLTLTVKFLKAFTMLNVLSKNQMLMKLLLTLQLSVVTS